MFKQLSEVKRESIDLCFVYQRLMGQSSGFVCRGVS